MVITTHTDTSGRGNSTGYTVEELNVILKDLYKDLLKGGYKVHEIDQSDIHWLIEVYSSTQNKKFNNKRVSIEQVL